MSPTAVVVDDSPVEAQVLQRILGEIGVTVLAVETDGGKGWDAIEKHKPTLCTLDVNLPNMNGISIARRIKDEKLPTKIVICTAMRQGAVRRQLDAIGIAKFLAKPFDDVATARDLKSVIDG